MTNMQGDQKREIDHSKAEAESTTSKLTLVSKGLILLEASNRIFGGPIIERIEIDSDNEATEKEIVEVNAEELINRHKTRSISYLPVLGREKIIAKGWSHLIAGDPKVGKTELMTRIITEWDKEKVLYITEESEELWSFRLSKLPRGCKRKHILFSFALGATPETILKRILEGNETVVIIDTIRTFFRFADETDNSEVNRVLTPFIKAARDTKKTILFIHHTRKKGGKNGKAITGGHAFLGSVDIAIELNRKGNTEQRELTGQGRLIEIEDFVYERSQGGSFIALGSSKDVSLDAVKKRIMKVLNREWKSTMEVRFALDNPSHHLTKCLRFSSPSQGTKYRTKSAIFKVKPRGNIQMAIEENKLIVSADYLVRVTLEEEEEEEMKAKKGMMTHMKKAHNEHRQIKSAAD